MKAKPTEAEAVADLAQNRVTSEAASARARLQARQLASQATTVAV